MRSKITDEEKSPVSHEGPLKRLTATAENRHGCKSKGCKLKKVSQSRRTLGDVGSECVCVMQEN